MVEQTSDFIRLLPRTLQRRFDGLGSYVTAVLEENDIKGLTLEEREFLQLLVFVRALETFLRDGHRAAEMAVATFSDLGVASFSIGRQSFSEGSEAVLRGKHLADGLQASIQDSEMLKIIDEAPSLKDLIVDCAYRMRRSV